MYYAKEVVELKNPIVLSTNMHYISPICNFTDKYSEVSFLNQLQENILAKFRVLLHNVQCNLTKTDINIQDTQVDLVEVIYKYVYVKINLFLA